MDTPARHIYTGDGTTRGFRVPTKIIGDDYVRIELDGIYVSDRSVWDIVNNTILFIDAPAVGVNVDIQIATSQEALGLLGSVTNVDIVAEYIDNVNAVGTNIEDVLAVYNNLADINLTVDNMADINTVADGIGSINTVAADLNEIISEIETVANDLNETLSEIETVGANIAKVTTVSDNIASVNTTSTNIGSVNTTATNIVNINSVATTIVPNIAEILLADTNAGIATTQAGLAISAYDSFDDRYLGTKTLDPTLDNDNNTLIEGAIYWNSSFKQMRVWSGTAWIPMSTGSGASGGGADSIFYENDQVVSNSYSITEGKNAMTTGPITIADGVTLTIPDGSTFVVI